MPKTRRNSSRARKKASLQRAVTEKTNKRMTSSVDEVERAWHFLKPLIVLLGTGLIGQITLYVEGNPTGGVPGGDPSTILDTGFVATKSSHQVLANNPFLNDLCALANSILVVAALYAVYVALWVGDFGLAFDYCHANFFVHTVGGLRTCHHRQSFCKATMTFQKYFPQEPLVSYLAVGSQ